jgi:hypothetical protein
MLVKEIVTRMKLELRLIHFDDFGCDAFVMGKKLRPRKSDRNLPNYLTA